VDLVVGGDAHEVLVEGPVVNRAKTEAVRHARLAFRLEIADDMCRVEQARLLQPADGTAARVGHEHPTAEPGLMEPYARFTDAVTTLDRVFEPDRKA
jgi:hypothetical protein